MKGRRVPMDPACTRSATASLIVMLLRGAEVVFVNIRPDVASQVGAGLLIEAKMDASVDARVADIVRDLVEAGVVEGEPRHGGVRHGDGMATGTVDTPQNLGGTIACASVIRRITGET